MFTCVLQRGRFRDRAVGWGLCCGATMAGLFPGAPGQQDPS